MIAGQNLSREKIGQHVLLGEMELFLDSSAFNEDLASSECACPLCVLRLFPSRSHFLGEEKNVSLERREIDMCSCVAV